MSHSEILHFARQINKSGVKLLNILEDIFQIIELESGNVQPTIRKHKVGEIFTEVFDDALIHRKNQGQEHIRILLDLPPEIKKSLVETDKTIIKKIFQNLVHNTLKFSNEGEVRVGARAEGNQGLQFYVSDTGSGIPHEKQHLLFKRFRQLGQRLKREYGGTGLGLYYCKMLIGILHGNILVESTPGEGTTIHFSTRPR